MHRRLAAAITIAALALRARAQQLRRTPDAGLTTVEYLIWIAIIAGIVIAIGATISTLFTDKANGLSLN
jgi:hypothetical protein